MSESRDSGGCAGLNTPPPPDPVRLAWLSLGDALVPWLRGEPASREAAAQQLERLLILLRQP